MRAARHAVAVTFLLNGLLMGSFAVRIPAIRERLDLSDGSQGFALLFIALGSVVAMPLAGAMAARYGSRFATTVAVILASAGTGVVALAPSLAALCALLFFMGGAHGSLDVSMNAHGVAVERRYGRPILSGFHAAFSVGGLLGAALGGLAAGADIDARVHLGIVGAACVVAAAAASRFYLPAGADAAARDTPLFARPPARIWALGAVACACMLIEGASADWSAVYMRLELGTSAGVAALGFTSFSVTMTLFRVVGDRLTSALGPATLLRAGGALAAAGFGLALLAGSPAAAVIGFACLGAGMACVVPNVFRAAGTMPDVSPGVGLAGVATMGYFGFVLGPPLIGGLATLMGLPAALGLLVLLAAVVAALAGATGATGATPAPSVRMTPARTAA
jgi:MFS family permease